MTNILHQITASATQINQAAYAYNPVGNRTSLTDRRGAQAFGYDTLDRVTSASHPLLATPQAFAYDPVGNRTTGGSVVNVGNQLTADATYAYQYGDNGNLTRKTLLATGNFTTYTYDAENRLIKVEDFVAGNPTPAFTSTYRYDGLGRRIEKVGNGVTRRYIYDGEDILLEYDGANVLQTRYTHGPGIDEPIAVTKAGSTFFYHQDGLETVTDLTDSTGAMAKSYAYDAYGTIVDQTGTVDQPYTYTGREFDSESRLYNYRARTYDPAAERFIQKDPILLPFFPTILPSYPLLSASHNQRVWLTPTLLASPERLHAYTYVANSPMFYSDAFGLLFGIPAGESFGEESALYWADLYDQTGNPFYWIPGSLASLWTPCTSNETFLTLAGGYTARVFGPFSTKGIPRPLAKLRRYARFDPPHHGKGWHFDGTLFK